MTHYNWSEQFHQVWDKAVQLYRKEQRDPATYFDAEEIRFLQSIGHTAQEVYDFAEDFCRGGDPSFETALLIAAVRRDYFLVMQKGKPSTQQISMNDLPTKDAEVDGIAWLPRIIEKARAKLRGEMPTDLMYDCGGDRGFLAGFNIHPADFLRTVWSARADNRKIIEWVKSQKPG